MIYAKEDRCDFCGTCVAVCPWDAIDLYEARIVITEKCTDCMLCVYVCPVEALAHRDTPVPISTRACPAREVEVHAGVL